ncbi:CEAM1 protein, partial [Polypterus senegalus]
MPAASRSTPGVPAPLPQHFRVQGPKGIGASLAVTMGPYRIELQSSVPVAPKDGPELPILSVSPNKPVYAAGSSLILQCSAQSNPTAQYQWFLNGISLNKRGQELEIRNIQVDQAGNYTCWAYNNVTLRYAAAHRDIDVIDPVSVPTIQSNVTNPAEFNDTVTLTCTASGSDVSFRWFNGSSEVLDIQRIHLSADNRTLTISGLLRSDDGPFYCYVYNHVSNGTSSL